MSVAIRLVHHGAMAKPCEILPYPSLSELFLGNDCASVTATMPAGRVHDVVHCPGTDRDLLTAFAQSASAHPPASPKSDRSGAKAKRTANGCIAFRPASEVSLRR